MSKIKIADVNVPTKGVGKYFSLKLINLTLPGTTPTFYWEVNSEVTAPAEEADEQPLKMPGEVVINGNLTMTDEEYSQWGTDDTYAIDWALQQLGFQKL